MRTLPASLLALLLAAAALVAKTLAKTVDEDGGGGGRCAGSRPAVLGLRCDAGAEVRPDGALALRAGEPAELLLIGPHLAEAARDPAGGGLWLALTTEPGDPQQDCTHTDRVKSWRAEPAGGPGVARVTLELAWPGHSEPFYLCLRANQSSRWLHQGRSRWLQVLVRQELLPIHLKILLIACLLMVSGLFSGLNLGLMALDKNELQVIISCGSDTEKRYARAIEPVRRRGNYLLCSILFSNVLVNSTIAVLLEELTSGVVAIMTSTIFIVMFGEILPQAFCSRHGLAVGAKTVAITYFCMIVTFPLSWPVSCCLDWVLGEEIGHAYDRERLMEFIRVTRDYNNLETDEVNIISGALKLKRIQLAEVMTRIEDVFMLDEQALLDFDTVQTIVSRGYSRIPVHEAGNKRHIVALLLAKDLALLDPDARIPLRTLISFYNHPIMYLFEDTTLDLALNEFKTGKSHMALVRRVLDDGDRDPLYELTGIVTLEDVIEEIMQMEINDETDTLSDNRRKRRRKEAQLSRRDFAQFGRLASSQGPAQDLATPQLCLAAYQFLATSVEPFSPSYLSDQALRQLLAEPIYHRIQLEPAAADVLVSVHQAPTPERHLFRAGEPADHFVMLLEGRVQVSCGREQLAFHAGPFSCFGRQALALDEACGGELATPVNHRRRRPSAASTPAESAAAAASGSTTADGGQLSISLRRLDEESDGAEPAGSRFVPDYSVEVIATTSYLKVSRAQYLAAWRASRQDRHPPTHNRKVSPASRKPSRGERE